MIRTSLLVLLLVGCYSPSYRDCEVSCVGGTCPSGLTCDHEVCRVTGFTGGCGQGDGGVTVDVPPGDFDGDGVMNADDNCIDKRNPDQADEDGDLLGDVCDPCPPFASAADNADGDQDGVGDSCDPSPTTAGNALYMFEGFNATTLPTGATINQPNGWAFGEAGGVAHVQSVIMGGTATQMTLSWPMPPQATGGETVLARFTVKSIDPNFRPAGGGVTTKLLPGGEGAVCWVGKDDLAASGTLKLWSISAGLAPRSIADPLVVMRTYTPDFTRRDLSFTCNESGAANSLGANVNNANGNSVGVLFQGVEATINWVMIVSGT